MTTELSIVPILYLLGAAQGVFLALALFTSKAGSRTANRYLGALTLVFVLALVDYFLDLTKLREQYIWLRALLWPKEYLYGILIYFYVRELTRPKEYFLKGKQWLHFIPAVLHVIVAWALLFLNSERQRNILDDKVAGGMPDSAWAFLLGDFELFTTIFQISIYLVLSFWLLSQHTQRIKQTFSYSEKVSLNWLRVLLVGIFIVYFIWLMEELLSTHLKLEETFDMMLGLSMVVLIYTMGYLGLRQPEIFTHPEKPFDKQKQQDRHQFPAPEQQYSEQQKYKNSPLSPDLSKSFSGELEQLMEQDKPYLDSKLSLPQLAEKLGISINYLSQIINEQQQQNFFEYINSYRIKEAKERLKKPLRPNENILTVAMDSGFNSKSAFYTAFRKQTSMTPNEYRKAVQGQSPVRPDLP